MNYLSSFSAFFLVSAAALRTLLPVAFLSSAAFLARDLKRSTRPSVSMIFSSPVKKGCDAEEICTLIKGYSLPSVHLMVSSDLAVDFVRNEKLACSSAKTTGR